MPLDPKLTKFTTASQNLATYSYTDLADGSGIITFYGGGIGISGANLYKLDTNIFRTGGVGATTDFAIYRTDAAEVTYTKKIDIDFDTNEFNTPRTVKGRMLAELPITYYTAVGDTNINVYAYVEVIKVDASDTETSLASEYSPTFNYLSSSGTPCTDKKYLVCPVEIPLTNFKMGEKIRINVQIWAKYSTSTAGLGLCYEPYNTAITAVGTANNSQKMTADAGYTQMRFNIPFRIEE